MELRVTRAVIEHIRAAAAEAAPEECCGLLFGTHGVIQHAQRTQNVAADRRRHFEIDPQALIDAWRAARTGGPAIVGYYHSHPTGRPEPSATDRAQAAHDGNVWAIAAQGAVAFWRDDEEGFVALPYGVEDS